MKASSIVLAIGLSLAALPVMAQDRTTLGVGVASGPGYQGSDDNRTVVLPIISIERGRFFADLRNGVGYKLIDESAVEVGASLAFMPGYRRRDVPTGLDRLSNGAGARAFTALKLGGLKATIGATQAIDSGTRGLLADASLAYPLVLSPKVMIVPAVGATWGDRKYNDRYFGVTNAEAARSSLPSYRLGAGFKDVSASATGIYRVNARVSLSTTLALTRLVGDAADSPMVAHKTRPQAIVSAAYNF